MDFSELPISKETIRAVQKLGYTEMTAVQEQTIPPMLEGKDIIAKAPTGTGKTCAFGIPIIERVDVDANDVQALVLAPTRELAVQIYEELLKLAQYKQGIRIACVYGGQPINKQILKLKKQPQVLVATPGRLSDHLNRRTVRLDAVEIAVLDEADRMLDMGFMRDVTAILDKLTARKQLAMLSATLTREVMDIGWIYQRDPVEITVPEDELNKPRIAQFYLSAQGGAKMDYTQKIIEQKAFDRVIVFCNTKRMTDRLTLHLKKQGLDADCLHGDMRQQAREKVMEAFKKGRLRVLVATDVAARGIDVDDVDAVINYDMPDENDHYLHRIGRTGRAKKTGESYMFVNFVESVRLTALTRYTKTPITELFFDQNGRLAEKEDAQPQT